MNVDNDPGICSFVCLSGFGGSIPMDNSHDTDYTNSAENYQTFEAFVAELKRWADKDEVGDYDIPLCANSLIMAACVMPTPNVTKGQPLTISYFQKLGFTEKPVPSYGKYPHGLTYFFISGGDLEDALSLLKVNPSLHK